MYQPLRTKHCYDCNKCIRTHDHHCPWIGTCVGEMNRCFFFWFLFFQLFELFLVIIEIAKSFIYFNPSAKFMDLENAFLATSIVALIILFMMVLCLFFYHTFLALSNMTTWEKLSWERITYLNKLSESSGSPFSRSLCKNLAVYCCPICLPKILRKLCFCNDVVYGPSGEIVWEAREPHVPCVVNLFCILCTAE